VVAIDPSNGSILAMVSKTRLRPESAGRSQNRANVVKAWSSLTKNPADPLINRAIGGDLYPPGSVLQAGHRCGSTVLRKVQPRLGHPRAGTTRAARNIDVTCPNDWNGSCGANDQTTISNALRISCNTAFGWLGMDLGAEALRAQAQAFGIGAPLQVPLSVDAQRLPQTMNKPQSAQSAIGQYNVRVTPLQVAMVTAAIANGGVMMKPNLIKVIRTADLQVIQRPEPEKLGAPITPTSPHN